MRVPMIARWPGRVPEGRKSDFIWYFPDFFPTAAELAGARGVPKRLDGISVVPELLGKPQRAHEFFLLGDAAVHRQDAGMGAEHAAAGHAPRELEGGAP